MTRGDKGKLFILFVPLFTLSLLSKIACVLPVQELVNMKVIGSKRTIVKMGLLH